MIKFYFLITLLFIGNYSSAAIKPSEKESKIIKDALFPFQWYSLDSGQIIYEQLGNIHTKEVYSKSRKFDLGLEQAREYIDKNLNSEVLVAVLDYGIDSTHEDLQGSIKKDLSECTKDGYIKLNPKDDNNTNGLPGDCMGWNFAAGNEKIKRN